MANDSLLIERPWNLDADLQAATAKTGAPEPVKLPTTLSPTPQVEAKPVVIDDDMFANIMDTASKTSGANKKNPFDSKFQDVNLTNRYEGRNIQYGDYKLDPKLLDARYSKTQSYAEQSYNSLKVGLANGGAMFALGMLGLPSLLDNIKAGAMGQVIEPTEREKRLYEMTREVAEKNTNFQNEQDIKEDVWSTIKNVVLPSALSGSSSGWGKIFENVMYGVGAGASLAVQEAAATFITAGVGNSAVLATSVARLLNNVNNIRKYSTLANRIVESSEAIAQVGSALNTSNRIKTAAKWAYASTIGAHGEAAFEGIEGSHVLETNLKQRFREQNGYDPTGKELSDIKRVAQQAGGARYWLNMGLLMGTNSFQLKRLFGNINLSRQATEQLKEQGLKVGINESGEAVAKKAYELSGDWWNRGFQKNLKPTAEYIGGKVNTDFVKESLSEGFEEFTQGWIDKGVNNYYTWKLDHRGQSSLDQALKSVSEGFHDSWNKEGLEAFLSGAIAGVGQQAMFSVPNAHKQFELARGHKEALNKVLAEYNSGFNFGDFANSISAEEFIQAGNVNSVRGTVTDRAQVLNALGVIDEVAEMASNVNDKKTFKDMEALSLWTQAMPYISRGHGDILRQQFEFGIDALEDSEVSEMFNVPGLTKDMAKQQFAEKLNDADESYSRVKRNFVNPYSAGSRDVAERNKYWAYEKDFLPELAYLDYRVKNLVKRKEDIQEHLGPYYDDFKYFADESTLPQGRQQILTEIERYKASESHLTELGTEDAEVKDSFNKEKHIKKLYEQALVGLDKVMSEPTKENVLDFYEVYKQAFSAKNNMDGAGFIDKEEVAQNINDVARITADLDAIQNMLRAYLQPKGHEVFFEGLAAASRLENRKRTIFAKSAKFRDLIPALQEEHPTLTPEEIQEVLENSVDEDEARKLAKEAEEAKKVEEIRRQAVEDAIRNKFVSAGRGQHAEDFILSNPVGTQTEEQMNKKVDDFISTLDDEKSAEVQEENKEQFTNNIKALFPDFDGEGFKEEGDNQALFDALSKEDKLKYTQALIQYYKDMKNVPGATTSFKANQDRLIKLQERYEKMYSPTKDETPKTFTEAVGDYTITKDPTAAKFTLSKFGVEIGKYKTIQTAKAKIKALEQAIAKRRLVSPERTSNLSNKYENGFWNPEWFDKNSKRITQNDVEATRNRIRLFNSYQGKTEQQIAQDIAEHAVVRKYTLNGDEGTTRIYPEDKSNELESLLPQERILKSMTVDTHVLFYDDNGTMIPLNSYKHYLTGLGFMPRKIIEKEFIESGLPASEYKGSTNYDALIKFMGDDYYQFLQRSVKDPDAYNLLEQYGFLFFKGTPQEQIDELNEMQKVWDFMRDSTQEEIREKIVYDRVFVAHEYANPQTMELDGVHYPFAQLSRGDGNKYNQRVFFRIADDFNNKELTPDAIELVGLPDDFHADAKELIRQSFASRFENQEIYSGYFTLVTDSKGNPAYFSLVNRKADADMWWNMFQANGTQDVAVVAKDDKFTLKYDIGNKRWTINDKSDESFTYVDQILNGPKSVEDIETVISTELSTQKEWYRNGEKGKPKETFRKVLPPNNIVLSLVESSRYKPTTQAEIMATRMISGISPKQYKVHKIAARMKTEMDNAQFVGIEQKGDAPVGDVIADDVYAQFVDANTVSYPLLQSIADKVVKREVLSAREVAIFQGKTGEINEIIARQNEVPLTEGVNSELMAQSIVPKGLPDFVSTEEIDTFVNNIETDIPKDNIVRTILLGIAENMLVTDLPFYLNEEMNFRILENFSKLPNTEENNEMITNSLKKSKAKLNLFTTRTPYSTEKPTSSEIERRVQELIENCIR